MARLTIDASMPMVIKSDWPMRITGVDQDGTVTVAVMDRDPNLYNRPNRVWAVFYMGTPPADMTGQAALAAGKSGVAVVPPPRIDGADVMVSISVLGVGAGSYTVLLVGEYDS
jgi:hypothetical protein